MAFKEVASLDADTTITLGGTNKKTGKKNPTQIEGYYLGSKTVDDKKKKSGVSYIYIFQTAKGNVGVWGKTDMDKKMQSATPGAMTRVTSTGTRPTPNGDMYTFKVEIDLDNTTDAVPSQAKSNNEVEFSNDDSVDYNMSQDEDESEGENEEVEEAPVQVKTLTNAERQAKVAALLKGNKGSSVKAG